MLRKFKPVMVFHFTLFILIFIAYPSFSEEKATKAPGEVKMENAKTKNANTKEVKTEKSIETANKKEEEINLNTEQIFALKEEYLEEKKNLKVPSSEPLLEIVKKYLAEADGEYELKKKSGNTKGMAMARDAKKVFSVCLDELEKDGKMTLPENFRKDLTEKINKFKEEVQPILEEGEKAVTEFEGKYFEKFSELMNPLLEEAKLGEGDKDATLKKYYERFCNEEIKPAPPTKVTEGDTEKKNSKVESSVIGTKGFGDTWVDVGEWIGEMQGMDVVNIKIGSSDDYTEEQPNPMSGNDSKLTYKVIYPVLPRSDYAFRIVKMPDKYKVDILEWPNPSNNMTLVVRTQPIAEFPAVHGFIVQISLPANEIYKVFNKETMKKSTDQKNGQNPEPIKNKPKKAEIKKIVIEFESTPQKATIYIDNLVQNGKDGFPIKTPCKIQVEPRKYSVKFIKMGYLDKVFEGYNLDKPKKVTAELEKDPKVIFNKYQIGASCTSEKSAGITLKKGQKIIINSTGKWKSAGKDGCDVSGYPNILKNYDLYMDNVKFGRVTDKANFGALIYKIGKKGVFAACKDGEIIEVPEDGELIFDVNERLSDRKDNSGTLNIEIIVFSEK